MRELSIDIKYIKERLAKFKSNPNLDNNSYVWKSCQDSTNECSAFMDSCDDENVEMADKKFIHNSIEYFDIKTG